MTPPTILLSALAIITIAKGMSWWIAREKPRPELAEYGDVVRVPEELAATRAHGSGGMSGLHAQRPVGFARHIAHDSGASK